MATRKTGTPSARTTTKPVRSSAKAKPAPKAAATKSSRKPAAKSSPLADDEVTIDRRRSPRRTGETKPKPVAPTTPEPKLERREKVNRRRQIDPTTCERDYSDQEVEFMNALDIYKRTSGRMFPTCSEVLEVIRGLGYVQLTPAELAARNPGGEATDDTAPLAVAVDLPMAGLVSSALL